jgi:CheY-like chemotaxis protein
MNGLEAIEILARENNIDLILLDINMPVMNGVQFMEKIKNDKTCKSIPIIVISTEGKEEDTLRALKLGAWGYVIKPFKPEVLHDLIEKVMAKMKATPTEDALFGKGYIRKDGRKVHKMYLFEVKKPEETKGAWDYYKLAREIPGEEAFRPMDQGGCPLVK